MDGISCFSYLDLWSSPNYLAAGRGVTPLPPGPICTPTTASLEAVLNPTSKGYYYYVLVLDGQNRHHFSKTLKEHNKYVQKLKEMSKR